MTKPTLPAEDAEEKPSTDNTNPAVLVDTPEQKPEDVFKLFKNLDDGWGVKVRSRKGQGSGTMRYLKDVSRRAKNHFRSENNFVKALGDRKVANKGQKSKVPRRRLK
jgi:hypothetical protein